MRDEQREKNAVEFSGFIVREMKKFPAAQEKIR
jgi:hypothetical protein